MKLIFLISKKDQCILKSVIVKLNSVLGYMLLNRVKVVIIFTAFMNLLQPLHALALSELISCMIAGNQTLCCHPGLPWVHRL